MSSYRTPRLVYRGMEQGVPFALFECPITGMRLRAYDYELLRKYRERIARLSLTCDTDPGPSRAFHKRRRKPKR